METKGMNILEKVLREYSGKDAIISISHKLYGDQKLKVIFNLIWDEQRIGFVAKSGNEIFIYKTDLVDYGIKDGIYFADNLTKIDIKIA